MASSLYWDGLVGGWKGTTKRSPHEETALRVRILDGKHIQDVYDKLQDELGHQRVKELGPLDMSRNPLEAWTRRIGKAYIATPPMVTGLGAELALAIGDQSAFTTVLKYGQLNARPMPTRMQQVSNRALIYRIGCNYSGVGIGYSPTSRRPFLFAIPPDDLDVIYASDDPLRPTVIRHRLTRQVDGEPKTTVDVYDLTDPDNPWYRTYLNLGGEDITAKIHQRTFEGDDYWWRYSDGRPFHRIIIGGDPREPYRGVEMVELTLKICMFYTHFGGGIRDAGHPQRNVRGLKLVGEDSQTDPNGDGQGMTGISASQSTVLRWIQIEDDDRGDHWQDNPGADLDTMFRAIQGYEQAPAATALGLPLDFSRTGGEPTAQEQAAVEELIAATYPECRGSDGLILRRTAAVMNRAAEDRNEESNIPESGYGVLYRQEVTEALETVNLEPTKPPTPEEA